MSEYTTVMNGTEVTIDVACLWCGQDLVDGREESGYTGKGPDWMTEDGDFGCGDSPDTGDDGTGGHTPDWLVTWDGNLVHVENNVYQSADVVQLWNDTTTHVEELPAGFVPAVGAA